MTAENRMRPGRLAQYGEGCPKCEGGVWPRVHYLIGRDVYFLCERHHVQWFGGALGATKYLTSIDRAKQRRDFEKYAAYNDVTPALYPSPPTSPANEELEEQEGLEAPDELGELIEGLRAEA